MSEQVRTMRFITWIMVGTVFVLGIIAFVIADEDGYQASSEAKMNFLRLIVMIVSVIQIAMAGSLKKLISFSANNEGTSKRTFAAQMTANLFCISPAIFGLALTFVSRTFMDYVLAGSLSLIALLIFFPKKM